MKQILVLMIAFTFAISLTAEVLNINTAQQNYTFDLTDIVGISFDDESMMLETPTNSHTFLFDDILYMDFDLTTGVEPVDTPQSFPFILNQNYPNPFNPDTNISFSLKETDKVEIIIYNSKGQKVRTLVDGNYSAGEHVVNWNGKTDEQKSATSGVYFYRMGTNGIYLNKKMILLK